MGKMCPFGKYIGGARVRFEGKRGGGDDTALNGLQIRCVDRYWKGLADIEVYKGLWGGWKSWVSSEGNLVKDAQVRFEGRQGSSDDTALNGIKFSVGSVPSPEWNREKYETTHGKQIDGRCQATLGSYCERLRTQLSTKNCNTYSIHFDVCKQIP